MWKRVHKYKVCHARGSLCFVSLQTVDSKSCVGVSKFRILSFDPSARKKPTGMETVLSVPLLRNHLVWINLCEAISPTMFNEESDSSLRVPVWLAPILEYNVQFYFNLAFVFVRILFIISRKALSRSDVFHWSIQARVWDSSILFGANW
jgi:hypothetical protein